MLSLPSDAHAVIALVYVNMSGPLLIPPLLLLTLSKTSRALIDSPPATHAIMAQLYSFTVQNVRRRGSNGEENETIGFV